MRDEFSAGVKQVLAHRAGYRCSKPDCRASTAGPSLQAPTSKSSIGVAAHITAAAPGGPRYDPHLTREERSSAPNGIWLCQNHAKEVDDDATAFTVEKLRAWKVHAEVTARALLGRPIQGHVMEAAVEVSLQRSESDGLIVVVGTNINGPWRQPEPVIEIVGEDGFHLAGPYADLIDSDCWVGPNPQQVCEVHELATGLLSQFAL